MRIIYSSILTLSLFVLTNGLQAQQQPALIASAKKAESNLQYAKAATYYQQYIKTDKKASATDKNAAIEGLANCYWNMRNYALAEHWYNQLTTDALANSEKTTVRKAEILARRGAYADAASLLINIPTYAAKAQGYKNTAAYLKDSADWTLHYLDINTKYFREFSPALSGSSLIWSTNEPTTKKVNGVMAWDNKGYTRLVQVADQASAQNIAMPESVITDSAIAAALRAKFLVPHYNNADKSLLQNTTLPADLAALRKTKPVAAPLGGLEKLKFNNAHLTVAGNNAFLSLNDQSDLNANDTRVVGIASATINDQSLSKIKFLPISTKDQGAMHPAIHPNGNLLVYTSNKAGGKGGFDLYVAKKINDSTWSEGVALNNLNTAGNEAFPSFAPNGTLYFTSDGLAGLGGMDIYSVSSLDKAPIQHLSAPVNSSSDDFGFTSSADGKSGYFTSDRFGSDDIFRFAYEPVKTKLTGTIKSRATDAGKAGVKVKLYKKKADLNGIPAPVIDAATTNNVKGQSIPGSKITIYDANGNVLGTGVTDASGHYEVSIPAQVDGTPVRATASIGGLESRKTNATINGPRAATSSNGEWELVEETATDANGNFSLNSKPNNDYLILIDNGDDSQQEILVSTENKFKNIATGTFFVDKKPEPIVEKVPDPVQFIIYFDFDKHKLKPESIKILDEVVALMQSDAKLNVTLGAHTDLEGTDKYNDKLSTKRETVSVEYLKKAGIDASRIQSGHFGETKPVELSRKWSDIWKNRRVEIVVAR